MSKQTVLYLYLGVTLIGVICVFVMKKINPEAFRVYLIYAIIVDLLLGIFFYFHVFAQ